MYTMKKITILILIIIFFASCEEKKETIVPLQNKWKERKVTEINFSTLEKGKTYLPLYSHIYHTHENRTSDLTITISIRNISATDSVYILTADYYNTKGDHIRQYLKQATYLLPLETIEIVIGEKDNEGGSGANFVFDWAVKNSKNPPLFEAVMISTYYQQGLSFVTRGVQIFE